MYFISRSGQKLIIVYIRIYIYCIIIIFSDFFIVKSLEYKSRILQDF